ncbi:MAG: Tol-Pal system beta propeller repeat protein TolB [Candidatus Zixiibacteriota bacterium]|nr:MAG: Tol-Pal system beta propeller repeat protein TolB [candidate division Zixibacteria bacterium]
MIRTALLLCLFLTISMSVSAQDVPVFPIDTIRTGDVRPTPIGVEAMKFVGNRYITRDDSALMRYTTTIIQRDIDFFSGFKLVELDSFYLKTYEISELDFLGWERLGADLLVKLEAEFPGQNLRVTWRLHEVVRHRQVARGRLEYNRAFWRELGHDIANDIVYHLTGERGIFRTKIAYIRQIGSSKEVFLSDYDGGNERQLTHTGTTNLSPAFSPDGKDIYFTSYLEGDHHLYKVSVESGQVTKVAGFPGLVAAPSISPDGTKIACVLTKDGNSEIYLLDLNGRVIKRLTNHWAIDSSPTWSPDGSMLAFSSDRTGSPQIYTMDAFGLKTRRVTYDGYYNDSPIWSHRGNRITFVSRTKRGRFDLASVDTSGADYRILTEFGRNENPHFSPDGKQIVFSSNRLGPFEIFTMDLTGRNQRRLTRTGGNTNPTWGPLNR